MSITTKCLHVNHWPSRYFPMKPPSIPWFPPRRNSGSLRPAVACGYAGPYPPWDVEALRGSRSAMKSWWLCTRTTSRTGKEKPQKWNIKKTWYVWAAIYKIRFVYDYISYTRRRMVLNSFPFIDGIRICGYRVSIFDIMIGFSDIWMM